MSAPGFTWEEQPGFFLLLVALAYRRRRAEEVAPQGVEEGLHNCNDLLFATGLAHGGSGESPVVNLLNLVEVAAAALETAHATLLGEIGDEELQRILADAEEEAEQAEFHAVQNVAEGAAIVREERA